MSGSAACPFQGRPPATQLRHYLSTDLAGAIPRFLEAIERYDNQDLG